MDLQPPTLSEKAAKEGRESRRQGLGYVSVIIAAFMGLLFLMQCLAAVQGIALF